MKTPPRNEMHDVVDWLKEHFPLAFPRTAKLVRPLQLGIMEDILDFYDRLVTPPFSKKRLRSGLNFYTSSKAYLKAQQVGAMRVNLYGFDVEAVSDEQANYALDKMNERYPAKKVTSPTVQPAAELEKVKGVELEEKLSSSTN